MQFRLYCTLKINDKTTGKLLFVDTGIYFLDEEDFGKVLRSGSMDVLESAIMGAMIPEEYVDRDNIISDLDYVVLSEDFDEDEDDEE